MIAPRVIAGSNATERPAMANVRSVSREEVDAVAQQRMRFERSDSPSHVLSGDPASLLRAGELM